MALLLFKKLILPSPTSRSGNYTPLPSHHDIERGTSSSDTDRTTTSTATLTNEKLHSRSEAHNTSTTASTARLSSRLIADATIGLSDGLTVPFALTAGLSALGKTDVVIYGGLAELIAGGISMGLGGYLGARAEAEAYETALVETRRVVREDWQQACRMVRQAFEPYRISERLVEGITADFSQADDSVVDFLMAFHHRLAATDYTPARAYVSGLTISGGYFFGGLIPLLPYCVFGDVERAFLASVVLMAVALFVFGWVKTWAVGEKGWKSCAGSGVQMVAMGGLAAGAAMGCVKAIGGG